MQYQSLISIMLILFSKLFVIQSEQICVSHNLCNKPLASSTVYCVNCDTIDLKLTKSIYFFKKMKSVISSFKMSKKYDKIKVKLSKNISDNEGIKQILSLFYISILIDDLNKLPKYMNYNELIINRELINYVTDYPWNFGDVDNYEKLLPFISICAGNLKDIWKMLKDDNMISHFFVSLTAGHKGIIRTCHLLSNYSGHLNICDGIKLNLIEESNYSFRIYQVLSDELMKKITIKYDDLTKDHLLELIIKIKNDVHNCEVTFSESVKQMYKKEIDGLFETTVKALFLD
jgi:hypothetical protein